MMVWFGTLSVPIVEKLPVADIFDSAKLLLIKHMPGKESNWMGASGQVIPGWIAKWLGKGDLSDATSMFRFFLHDV